MLSIQNELTKWKTGIEPALTDWKSVVMPLDHIHILNKFGAALGELNSRFTTLLGATHAELRCFTI